MGDRVMILVRVVQGGEEDEIGPQMLLEVLQQKHDLSSVFGELAIWHVERVRLCADDCRCRNEFCFPLPFAIRGGLIVAPRERYSVDGGSGPFRRHERTTTPDFDVVRMRADAEDVMVLRETMPVTRLFVNQR